MFSAAGKSAVTSGYNINNSLRFRASAQSYLLRTVSTASNRQRFTYSCWVKRGNLGSVGELFGANSGNIATTGTLVFNLQFDADDTIIIAHSTTNVAVNWSLSTTQLFRDTSAWYHIILAVDTTQATTSNRVRLYVNGSEVTSFSSATYPTQNFNGAVNFTGEQKIGSLLWLTSELDGYMAEVNFIDGQQLTPSSFGETDTTTGVWKPKAYTGTYGTNGFYQKYSNIALTSGSNTGLGRDFSGNGNFFNTNNISVTAGVDYDAMTDSPTNTSATVSNYATINPLYVTGSTETPIINANLTADNNGGAASGRVCSIPLDGGKWYWEVTITTAGATMQIGVIPTGKTDSLGKATTGIFAYHSNGDKFVNGVQSAYGASYTTNDVIGMTYDSSTGVLTAYKNNVSQGTLTTLTATTSYIPYLGFDNGTAQRVSINFGQRPFVYTPPTGFNRLNTFNLPDSTIKKGNSFMDATLYAGNSVSPRSITNAASFRPDFVWIKSRTDGAVWHILNDSNRGANRNLFSNANSGEVVSDVNGWLSAFNNDGFALATGTTFTNVNTTGNNYVAWQWQAGQGTNSSNTNGTIPSTVSVNATAGFSIVTYTGTGANGTVGHGLGVAPAMIIVKRRDTTSNWQVRHTSIAAANSIQLNLQNAPAAATTVWNSTLPTSTVFSIGTSADVNASTGTYVAYCWAAIAGFSAFGSHTGNGNVDGPFVYTGFRPKFILFKNTSTTSNWVIEDGIRNPFNVVNLILIAEASSAETTGTTTSSIVDFLSNGFKIRGTGGTANGNNQTTIYAAFAENPFKNALAR